MKPSRFSYVAPVSVPETVDVLVAYGDNCKVLAGGQSLGPLLNLRLANPQVLVDLGRLNTLSASPRADASAITIFAMSRQWDIERNEVVAANCPLISQALPFVAHRTIRHRGTIGGSLVHADPAAELPAVALAMRAEFVAQGPRECRTVNADEFFRGYFTTALETDELLVSIRFPKATARSGTSWMEFAPRHGDYAIVGIAAMLELGEDGETITSARLAYSGVADVPWRHEEVDTLLLGGERARSDVFDSAACAAAGLCEPASDLLGSVQYRRHLVRVLTNRALEHAYKRAVRNLW